MVLLMKKWTDEWTEGQTDGWMDKWIDGQKIVKPIGPPEGRSKKELLKGRINRNG